MYTTKRLVPRITSQTLAALERVAPGVLSVAEAPMLTTAAEAEKFIVEQMNNHDFPGPHTLDGYEYVAEVLSVTEVEDGAAWEFRFRISGD